MSEPMGDSQTKSEFKSVGGAARVGKAFKYSMQGLAHAFRYEAAFRQELLFIVPLLAVLPFAGVSTIESLLLIALATAVLVVELLNSAIEAAVDRISLESHPLAGRAKDLGSAAVFLTITLFKLSWLVIVLPTLYARYIR